MSDQAEFKPVDQEWTSAVPLTKRPAREFEFQRPQGNGRDAGLLLTMNERIDSASNKIENGTRIMHAMADVLFGPKGEPEATDKVSSLPDTTVGRLDNLNRCLDRFEDALKRFNG